MSIEFSPIKCNLAFTAGLDKQLQIFTIDLETLQTKKSQGLAFSDMPIFSAHFLGGSEIIASGRRKHFYIYDLSKGNSYRLIAPAKPVLPSLERCFVSINSLDTFAFGSLEGKVLLYDLKSKLFKSSIEINGAVTSVCFDDSQNAYISSDTGDIYIFDLRKQSECIERLNDVGSFNTTSMSISPDSKYLSTGTILIKDQILGLLIFI